ncbi:hypothetical protein E5288_WYG006669 [Bos mutus]|uniref:40S ribosomal protein S12 n=1 Tax=Bos mutus TaxID=72004 RepID=A0A6B0RE68_9CETA|nr:hypothetical protein [Bos mutus]
MAEEGIAAGGVVDINTALQQVLKAALIHDGIPACGSHEAAKALDEHQAHPRVLVSNCDEPTYVKLVEALCGEHQISLIEVDNNKKLREWDGPNLVQKVLPERILLRTQEEPSLTEQRKAPVLTEAILVAHEETKQQ